jgi:hypothetical protein
MPHCAPGIGELSFFSSGGSDPLYKDFIKFANEVEETLPAGKLFDKEQVLAVIRKIEFEHNVYLYSKHGKSLKTICDNLKIRRPYEWSDEYIKFMATYDKKTATQDEKEIRSGLMAKIRAAAAKPAGSGGGKSAARGDGKASDDTKAAKKVKPAASGGPDKPAASGGGGGASKPAAVKPAASGGGGGASKPAAVKPAASGGGGGSKHAAKAAAPSHTIVVEMGDTKLFAPPATVYVIKLNGKHIFLAVPTHEQDVVPEAMGPLNPTFFSFEDFLKNVEQDENCIIPLEVHSYFDNFIGYNNFRLCEVQKEHVDITGIPDILQQYVTTRATVHKYLQVGINQYEDHESSDAFAPRSGPVKVGLTMALKFTDEHSIKDYFDELEATYKDAQEEKKREENNKVKQAFIAEFFKSEEPDDIRVRHAEYKRLKELGVIEEEEYLKLCEKHATDIMQAGGVLQKSDNIIVDSKEEVKTLLEAFVGIVAWLTPGIIDHYLEKREEILKLRDDAGDIRFNEKFEDENKKTLKEFVEDSQVPGLWPLFDKAYNSYLRNLELVKSIREAARKVVQEPEVQPNPVEPNAQPQSPVPGSPRGQGAAMGYANSSPDVGHAKKKARVSVDGQLAAREFIPLSRGDRPRKSVDKLNPRPVSTRNSRGNTRHNSPGPDDK